VISLYQLSWRAVVLIRSAKMQAPQGFSTADAPPFTLWTDLRNDIRTIAAEGKIRNVVIIGQQGSGKTTFLNTLYTAYSRPGFNSEEKPLYLDRTTDRGGAGTTKVVTPRAIDLGQGINIVDTWGWTETNYQNKEFKYLLQGHLKARWHCDYSVAEYKGRPEYWRKDPQDSDKMHGCIFIVAANAIESKAFSRLDEFLRVALEEGIRPVVLLSKVDLVDIDLNNDYKNVYKSPEIQRVCKQVRRNSGFISNQIFPCKLYYAAGLRSAHVEVTVLRCMKAASLQRSNTKKQEKKGQQAKRPANPVKWNAKHVASWLQDKALSRHKEKFQEIGIDGATLLNLDLDALKEMDLDEQEARKIIRKIRRLHMTIVKRH